MTKILCISYVGMNYIRKSNGICNALMEKFHFDPIFCAPHLVSHSDKHRVMYLRRMNKLTCMTSSQHALCHKKKNVSGNMPEKNGSIGRDLLFFFFLREALPCKIPEHRYTV